MRIGVLNWIGAALAAMLLASCAYGPYGPYGPHGPHGPPAAEARILYQIEVTAPGTRSQGWRGVLYHADSVVITLRDGEYRDTPFGRFVGVRCEHAWSTCGAIHVDMLRWMETNQHNIMARSQWTYRLYHAGGDQFRGELLSDGRVFTAGPYVTTPMGAFRWIDEDDRRGWFHVSLR